MIRDIVDRMRQWAVYIVFSLLIFIPGNADAENLANDKLLEILEQKGFLTEEEVKEVKGIITKEEEKEVKVVYEEGVHIRTNDKSFDTRIGGVIQTDLIAFSPHYPEDNDFDIRRARLFIEGRMFDYFGYKFEGEFEGASNDRLVDALMNFDYFPYLQLQVGQFKEPFSLENLISDKYLPFNERSMAYYLTPARDVGLMIHGTMFGDMINYGVGVFNGDGRDATLRVDSEDRHVFGGAVGVSRNACGGQHAVIDTPRQDVERAVGRQVSAAAQTAACVDLTRGRHRANGGDVRELNLVRVALEHIRHVAECARAQILRQARDADRDEVARYITHGSR